MIGAITLAFWCNWLQQSNKLLVYDLISSYFRQPIKLISLQNDPALILGRAFAAV